MKKLVAKVAGITFEGRQEFAEKMEFDSPIRLVAEPENKYDVWAVAVYTVVKGEKVKIGYLPKTLARTVQPLMEGEDLMGKVASITGGTDDFPMIGVQIEFEVPEPQRLL